MSEVRSLRAYAEVALGRQRSPQHDDGPFMTRYLRAANVKDGELDLTDVKEMNFDPTEQQRFSLAPGDVLVTEGSGSLASVGASAVWSGELAGTVCFQNTLLRLRPRASTDGRFLAWWCRHAFADGLFASISTGANIFHVSADRLRSLPMAYLPPERQRAIADFLDPETAHIDALVTKKRNMIALLDERRAHLRASAFQGSAGWRLKRVLRAPMAYGVLVPRFVEPGAGTPMIRIGALNLDGTIAVDRLVYIERDQAEDYRRTRVAAGDLVLSVVGSMGRSAVVDAANAGANLNRPLARLRPVEHLPARLLWHWTQTTQFLDQARLSIGGGTAQPTLNIGDLAEFETGLPADPATWQVLLDDLESRLAPIEAARLAIDRQIALLREHRQALITAAVTGELEVPGVAA